MYIYIYVCVCICIYIFIDGAILIIADVVGLYPSVPQNAGLEALKTRLNKRETF